MEQNIAATLQEMVTRPGVGSKSSAVAKQTKHCERLSHPPPTVRHQTLSPTVRLHRLSPKQLQKSLA